MAETILVVDDDPDIARFVEVNLRSAGYDVAVAGDGEAALERARTLRPDLVLLDVMMPRMTGLEFCAALRSDPEMGAVPILMLTAKAQERDVDHGFAAGADDYILKPFSPRELLTRVNAALARRRT